MSVSVYFWQISNYWSPCGRTIYPREVFFSTLSSFFLDFYDTFANFNKIYRQVYLEALFTYGDC